MPHGNEPSVPLRDGNRTHFPSPPSSSDSVSLAHPMVMHVYAHHSVDSSIANVFEEFAESKIFPESHLLGAPLAISLFTNAISSPPELSLVIYKTDALLSDATRMESNFLFLQQQQDLYLRNAFVHTSSRWKIMSEFTP